MVLLDIEPAHMADHKAVLHPQERPAALTDFRLKPEPLHVDRVAQDEAGRVPPFLPVIVDPGIPAAAPAVRRRAGKQLLAGQLQRILVIPDNPRIVRMRDPDPHPGVFGALQGVIPHGFVMRVNDPDVRVLMEQFRHVPPVPGKMQRVQARAHKHPSAHAADLFVILPRHRFVGQEIELNPAPVHFPVIIHQHGFDSRTRHIADGMQHTKHFS